MFRYFNSLLLWIVLILSLSTSAYADDLIPMYQFDQSYANARQTQLQNQALQQQIEMQRQQNQQLQAENEQLRQQGTSTQTNKAKTKPSTINCTPDGCSETK